MILTGAAMDTEVVARLSLALGRLTRVLRRDSPTGLGPGSVSAMVTVVRSGPIRLGDLAAREDVAPPTLTRIVANLEDCGFVLRSPDPADRRASLLTATPAAHDLVAGINGVRVQTLLRRLAALAEAEREQLLAAVPILEKLADDA